MDVSLLGLLVICKGYWRVLIWRQWKMWHAGLSRSSLCQTSFSQSQTCVKEIKRQGIWEQAEVLSMNGIIRSLRQMRVMLKKKYSYPSIHVFLQKPHNWNQNQISKMIQMQLKQYLYHITSIGRLRLLQMPVLSILQECWVPGFHEWIGSL